MKYEKPICDCGGELLFCVDEISTNFYKITNKGEESKRKYDSLPSTSKQAERLVCDDCRKIHPFTYDNEGRIIRSDIEN